MVIRKLVNVIGFRSRKQSESWLKVLSRTWKQKTKKKRDS